MLPTGAVARRALVGKTRFSTHNLLLETKKIGVDEKIAAGINCRDKYCRRQVPFLQVFANVSCTFLLRHTIEPWFHPIHLGFYPPRPLLQIARIDRQTGKSSCVYTRVPGFRALLARVVANPGHITSFFELAFSATQLEIRASSGKHRI